MMNRICILLFFLFSWTSVKAQIGYTVFTIDGPSGEDFILVSIDLATCEVCQLSNGVSTSIAWPVNDITMLPDGNWIGNSNCFWFYVLSPPPDPVVLFETTFPLNACVRGTVYDEVNDIVYVMAEDGLYTFDPNTYALSFIGSWPSEWQVNQMRGIHFTNGVLYGIGVILPVGYQLFEIDINDPSNSTLLFQVPMNDGQGSSPNGYYYTDDEIIGEYDVSTQTATPLCGPYEPFFFNTIDVPIFSLPDYGCICDTDAGQITTTNPNPVLSCVNEIVTVNPASGTELDPDDVLQYILFTDLNDTLGTIIATSNTVNFLFDPATMTIGVTYYFTSIAGDDDGTGNVDLTDQCFDISITAQIIEFVPEPTVTFSIANNEICENGCKEINAAFTGVPPFTLTYQVGNGAEVVEVFNTTNGNFEICIGAETGSIDLMATGLSDAVCCGD